MVEESGGFFFLILLVVMLGLGMCLLMCVDGFRGYGAGVY